MNNHTNHDRTPDLPDDLASIDAALASMASADRDATPDTLASRTLVRTNAIIAQGAGPSPNATVEHKPSPLMRIAAPFAVAATLALAAAISFQSTPTPASTTNESEVAAIAVAFDEWLDSEDALVFHDELDDDLRDLSAELDALESSETITLADAEYAL